MMKTVTRISLIPLFLVALGLGSLQASAGVAVIVNKDNSISSIDEKTASRLFLKKEDSFSNGIKAAPVDLNDQELKQQFYKSISRKSETQLRSYWARMVFSGKSQPPSTANSASEIISIVSGNVGGIGFIDEKDVNDKVKVVLTIN